MTPEGGSYCGQVRYKAEGKPMVKGQCRCRELQFYPRCDHALFAHAEPAAENHVLNGSSG